MDRWQTTIGLAALALAGIWITPRPPPRANHRSPVERAAPPLPDLAVEAPPERPGAFVVFDRVSGPRRLPTRPSSCTQPPPGGALQYEAVNAARSHACGRALHAVQEGLAESIDHCALFELAWLCFNEGDQRPLAEARFDTFDDVAPYLSHLEGTQAERRAQLAASPVLAVISSVYHPAPDGLEARLDAYGADPELQRFVHDLLGKPTIADHLAHDVVFEADLAAALSRVPEAERTAAMEQAWARRVYVAASALDGDAGALIHRYRQDAFVRARQLLAEAVEGDVPPRVLEAFEVATGELPLPVKHN